MGKIVRNGIEFSSTSDTANNINYDNSQSGLSAVTAQEAIDELNENVSTLTESLDNIDIRYNTETGTPEWSPRGADTFSPFKKELSNNVLSAISNSISGLTIGNHYLIVLGSLGFDGKYTKTLSSGFNIEWSKGERTVASTHAIYQTIFYGVATATTVTADKGTGYNIMFAVLTD